MKYAFVRKCLPLVLVLSLLGLGSARAQYSLSNLWSISTADSRPYLTSGSTERGIAYNTLNNHVYLTSRAGTPARVVILDGDTGAEVGFLNVTGINGGTFFLSMIAVAEDGAIYGGNLSGSATVLPSYKLYRWADESAAPVMVFNDNPFGAGATNNTRWGDNMDIRGSGTNTEVLVASDGLFAAILRPGDETMTSFTTTGLTISGLAATDMQKGVAFGTNNTFYAKRTGLGSLRHIRYNLAASNGVVFANYTIAAGVAGIAFDTNNLLVAGVQTANAATGHQLNVYDASLGGALPIVGTIPFPAPGTANPNLVGAADIGSNRVYAVDTHNGVVAAQIVISETPVAPAIATHPANQTVVQGGYTTLSAAVTGSRPITYQWEFNGTPIPDATNSSLLLTNITLAQAGNYRIVANNVAGSATSNPAILTVTPTVLSTALTRLWKRSPGELSFLGDSDNLHRGMAYNPQSGHLLVVSRTGSNSVHIIDANTGDHLGFLNRGPGIIAGGIILINMIAVTSDGFIYVGNLTLDGTTAEFRLYVWIDEDPNTEPILAWHGDPGAGVANRWGDTMAARIGSTGREILLGSRSGTAVSLLTPDFGENSTPFVIDVPGVTAGNFGLGIAFGEGETFLGKASGQTLQHVAFTLGTPSTATILHTFTNYPAMAAIGVDPAEFFLAGVSIETPDNVRLVDIANPNRGLDTLDTEFFATDNPNLNGTGALAFAPERLYALDSNNGLAAFKIAPRLHYSVSGNTITFTWSGPHTLQTRNSLTSGEWTDLAPSSGYSVTISATPGAQQYFRLLE